MARNQRWLWAIATGEATIASICRDEDWSPRTVRRGIRLAAAARPELVELLRSLGLAPRSGGVAGGGWGGRGS